MDESRLVLSRHDGGMRDFSLWKMQRSQVTLLIEEFLNHVINLEDRPFSKPKEISEKMWTAFMEMVPAELDSLLRSGHELVLLIDDNMYLHSMRHEYFKMARKFSAGFCEIFMESDVSEALRRNKTRSVEHVPEETIIKMAAKLEPPDRHKFSWEDHILVAHACSQFEIEPVVQLIEKSIADPVQRLSESDEEEKATSRYECSVSTLHQIDLILRKCVTDLMVTSRNRQLPANELKELGKKASKVKEKIIQEFKRNNQEFLAAISEFNIQDAAKDSQSNLSKFMYELFHSELS
ncbi:L-seryl-tRNA(Sec) kinase isoform X2 [Aplysia californica]|uniref:L-seryl-tRNA(Sec) kinase isoform X2 n=1 Tax=Aplysia californica TaxID=6500 RepID=A0ABM1A7V6_APLCA|nr:L-seryl-tRNA(Sec) kinase isoform X2 [Aplysia californica]